MDRRKTPWAGAKHNLRYRILNGSKGTTLASHARVATRWWERMLGLLFTNSIERGDGLFLTPCNSIHMIGMAYAIDAVFVDKSGKVVGLCNNIKPWQISRIFPRAAGCLELPPSTLANTTTTVGDIIEWHDAS